MSKPSSKPSTRLHLINGGYGDKEWLKEIAFGSRKVPSWIVPKNSAIGDDVVVNVAGSGLFATAKIASATEPRPDWSKRYGAALDSIRLISPAISLPLLQQLLPELSWARYPRSITTPSPKLADQIRKIVDRRKRGASTLKPDFLEVASIDELRATALLSSRKSLPLRQRNALYRARSEAIRLYALRRAQGFCEACQEPAPFRTISGTPYLEVHHPHRVADEGPDHPAKVIALCPNCHRRADLGEDAKVFNKCLRGIIVKLESAHR